MASKLKKVLGKVVREFQTAFVEGRSISDNYIVAHEVIHSFKRKLKSKSMGLKLDIAKPYDRME